MQLISPLTTESGHSSFYFGGQGCVMTIYHPLSNICQYLLIYISMLTGSKYNLITGLKNQTSFLKFKEMAQLAI